MRFDGVVCWPTPHDQSPCYCKIRKADSIVIMVRLVVPMFVNSVAGPGVMPTIGCHKLSIDGKAAGAAAEKVVGMVCRWRRPLLLLLYSDPPSKPPNNPHSSPL